MKVVILCGGKGSRLREETEYRPKPMMPIGNRPILWHIMKTYAYYGHREFILCLGYKGEMIRNYFRDYHWNVCDATMTLGRSPEVKFHNRHEEEDWTVTLADTGENSMTAYRIRLIEKYLGEDEEFLLTYGDGVGTIDIPASIEAHRRSGKLCTMTAAHPPGRFGELQICDDGTVSSFNEKPQAAGAYINAGYMVCSRRLFSYLPDDADVMLEQEPMKKLVADRQLGAFRHEGFWQPMDTFQEYSFLNRLWEEGKAPWKVW